MLNNAISFNDKIKIKTQFLFFVIMDNKIKFEINLKYYFDAYINIIIYY